MTQLADEHRANWALDRIIQNPTHARRIALWARRQRADRMLDAALARTYEPPDALAAR